MSAQETGNRRGIHFRLQVQVPCYDSALFKGGRRRVPSDSITLSSQQEDKTTVSQLQISGSSSTPSLEHSHTHTHTPGSMLTAVALTAKTRFRKDDLTGQGCWR